MVEYVPNDESVWDWTRKVTLQTLPRTRAPKGYVTSVAGTFAGGCEGAETATLFEGVQNGVEAAVVLATCPATDHDGKPAAFMMKAIDGGDLTYVVEWAWQGALPDAGRQAEAAAYLDGVLLCDDATSACPSG
jgi:hypothetical protein